jgi:hypothetical protein
VWAISRNHLILKIRSTMNTLMKPLKNKKLTLQEEIDYDGN